MICLDLMKTERKAEDPEEEPHSTIYRKSCLMVAVVHSALMILLLSSCSSSQPAK